MQVDGQSRLGRSQPSQAEWAIRSNRRISASHTKRQSIRRVKGERQQRICGKGEIYGISDSLRVTIWCSGQYRGHPRHAAGQARPLRLSEPS